MTIEYISCSITTKECCQPKRGGTDLNGTLNLFRRIERTHLLSVNSSHCSTNGPTFLQLECLDLVELAVERVGFQNFVKDEACLEEGNCFGFPLLLAVYFTGVYGCV